MRGVDMLIYSLKKHFPARAPEWFMGVMLLAWGCYMILHPDLFTNPGTAAVLSVMAKMSFGFPPAASWGLAAIFVAGTRLVALFINGAYTRTPLVRTTMSFLSAFIWAQVTIGLIRSGIPNLGLVVYPGLIALDMVSVYRAVVDVVYAERVRHEMRESMRNAERIRNA